MLDFVIENIFVVITATLALAGLFWTFMRDGAQSLSPVQAVLFVKQGGLFLDVRSADEYGKGHIARSKNFPADDLKNRVSDLNKYKNKPLVVVCLNGGQSQQALKQLLADGFSQVRILAGGMRAWREAQMPEGTH